MARKVRGFRTQRGGRIRSSLTSKPPNQRCQIYRSGYRLSISSWAIFQRPRTVAQGCGTCPRNAPRRHPEEHLDRHPKWHQRDRRLGRGAPRTLGSPAQRVEGPLPVACHTGEEPLPGHPSKLHDEA